MTQAPSHHTHSKRSEKRKPDKPKGLLKLASIPRGAITLFTRLSKPPTILHYNPRRLQRKRHLSESEPHLTACIVTSYEIVNILDSALITSRCRNKHSPVYLTSERFHDLQSNRRTNEYGTRRIRYHRRAKAEAASKDSIV